MAEEKRESLEKEHGAEPSRRVREDRTLAEIISYKSFYCSSLQNKELEELDKNDNSFNIISICVW